MYSGTTFRNKSGHIAGAHQRIDRLARRNIEQIYPGKSFPTIRQILHFEGNNGPDGIKRKSPSVDEPWHFIDPNKPGDHALLDLMHDHKINLVAALRAGDETRAAFEAAWLAHAIVDGLTPAHHYALSDTIEKLWGRPKEQRLSVKQKNIIKGVNRRDSLDKNWQYWGAKGVFATHLLFELGVASSMTTHRFTKAVPTDDQLSQLHANGFSDLFMQAVHTIHDLDMYHEFWTKGWTTRLARDTRRTLIPYIVVLVTLAWVEAIEEAEL